MGEAVREGRERGPPEGALSEVRGKGTPSVPVPASPPTQAEKRPWLPGSGGSASSLLRYRSLRVWTPPACQAEAEGIFFRFQFHTVQHGPPPCLLFFPNTQARTLLHRTFSKEPLPPHAPDCHGRVTWYSTHH